MVLPIRTSDATWSLVIHVGSEVLLNAAPAGLPTRRLTTTTTRPETVPTLRWSRCLPRWDRTMSVQHSKGGRHIIGRLSRDRINHASASEIAFLVTVGGLLATGYSGDGVSRPKWTCEE